MAAPTPYALAYDFTAFQAASPTTPLPADKVEIEYNALATTTSEIITNLGLIQRSDGALANAVVTFDSLSATVIALLGSAINPKGTWVTATAYALLDLVEESGSSYLCAVAHTSGTFATDLAADKWILWAAGGSITVDNSNWSGTDLSVANGGTGVSTLTGLVKGNGTSAFTAAVQGTDYYAPSGTDVAVADGGTGASTAAGARTNLGLGTMATQASGAVSITGGSVTGITDITVADGGTGASTAAAAFNNISAFYFKDKVLNGLTLANGTDATNDIDIAVGACVDDGGTTLMLIESAITKQLDAAWTVGTAAGGLDTGAIANTTYHVWVIHRTDTGVTDVLFSTSASAPTMPTNYTKKKCIGSIVRASGAIVGFTQYGNEFVLKTPIVDHTTGGAAGTSAITATLGSIPTGAKFKATVSLRVTDNANYLHLSSLDSTDTAPSAAAALLANSGNGGSSLNTQLQIWTNTSAQIRARQSTNSAGGFVISATGWQDTRR